MKGINYCLERGIIRITIAREAALSKSLKNSGNKKMKN